MDGLTTADAGQEITSRLKRFIPTAEVSVMVREVHSKKVYVIGAVRKEGPVSLQAPMTVLQAILEAGGLDQYAKRKKIYILRKQGSDQARFVFDYDAVLSGRNTQQNFVLQPDDTVVVPR